MINLHINVRNVIFLVFAMTGLGNQVRADDLSGWYAGVNVGTTNNSIDHADITSGLFNGGITTGGGMTVTSVTDANSATGFTLFGGYQLSTHFAVEAAYFDLGKLGYTAYTMPTGTLTGQMKADGVYVDGLASYPIDDNTALFLRAGVTFNQGKSDFSSSGAVQLLRTSYSDNSTEANFGLGGSRKIWQGLELRMEGERFRLDDGTGRKENVNMFSLGLVYRF
jgi:OmpA-OmpF porin, OOP family